MIRIVYIPVEDTKRTTKFLTELTESDLLDIKELIAINVLSINGEILHKVEMFQNGL